MRHVNIPIFIPHMGCPNMCVFCNQRSISGKMSFNLEGVEDEILQALSTLSEDDEVEIAFFGGSFTGIERDLMIRLLEISDKFVADGRVSRVRCSTRPDYIDEEIISILKAHSVETVELGIQSMSEEVLFESRRGHTAEDSRRACRLIKESGLKLVGQMMIGLPGADRESEALTAREICELGADGARVYPTVVFKNTALARMSERGEYTMLSTEQAVERTAFVLDVFDSYSLPVIRVGLHASENLSSPDRVLGGATHPAIGELAMGELFYKRMCRALDEFDFSSVSRGETVALYVREGALSMAIGQKRRNILRLFEKYCSEDGINRIKILEKSSLIGYNIIIGIL